MGLLRSLRDSRRHKKAAYKAAKVKAKAEAKSTAALEKRKEAYLRKTAKQVRKADAKMLKDRRKHEQKMAQASLAQIKANQFNAKTVLRLVGGARVAIPVLMPLIYRGLTQLQSNSLASGARAQGVKPAEVAKFSGDGAAQRARIDQVRSTLEDLPSGFVKDVQERLEDLEAAVANAESMDKSSASRVLESVSSDLELIETQVEIKRG